MRATAGIDIGSTAVKVVLVQEGAGPGPQVLFRGVERTGANAHKVAAGLLDRALTEAGLAESELASVVSTGYGRRLIKAAGRQVSEITANARAAVELAGGPGRVRTVIDIGGQDSKVISLAADGTMLNFAMNDKCAAGTGRFLEVLSRALEVDLADLGRVSLESSRRLEITSTCTVFAESEVVGLLAQGEAVADIAAATHRSVARKIGALALKVGIAEPVLFDGGAALNVGLRQSLAEELGCEMIVPEHPQAATALGAALSAEEAGETDVAQPPSGGAAGSGSGD